MTLTPWSFVVMGYLLGSVPFAYLLARYVGGVDIRYAGSGNVGAANVYRASGPWTAAAVAALDALKGAVAVALAGRAGLSTSWQVAAGTVAVVGHVYPVWLRFRGGKGVATACGVFSVLSPLATALAALVFVAVVWWTRYVSLGSIGAAVTLAPIAYYLAAPLPVVVGAVVCAAVILGRHRSNLARLHAGTERRLGQRA